jgi:2EXR family
MIAFDSNFADPFSGPPATTLHSFGKLPIELRLKIWGLAIHEPRFIEIEWGPKIRNGETIQPVICCGVDYRCRVTPVSRQTPAILHVSKEARDEAKKHYNVRVFDTKTRNGSEREIYYNPKADIIYFGEECCISTILSVFDAAPREPIPRVAITLSGQGHSKCRCDWDDETYGMDGGIDFLQALHGIFPPATMHDSNIGRWPGCLGLEKVYWVIPSNLWRYQQGQIGVGRHAPGYH